MIGHNLQRCSSCGKEEIVGDCIESECRDCQCQRLGHLPIASVNICGRCGVRLSEPWREGSDANDHNRRVFRKQGGHLKRNPYSVGSDEWKAWQQGYLYRDMVNDG